MTINTFLLKSVFWILIFNPFIIVNRLNAHNSPPKYVVDAVHSIETMLDSKGDTPLKLFINGSMNIKANDNQQVLLDKLRNIRKKMQGLRDNISIEKEDYGIRMIFVSAEKEQHLKVVLGEKEQAISDLELLEAPKPLNLTQDNLRARFDEFEKKGFSGLVYIKINGETKLEHPFGMANKTLNLKNKTTTIFGIGSRPIDFPIAGIYLLNQQGKVDLKDKITKYFENVPEDKQVITIEQLMTGSSGFPDFFNTEDDWDPDLQWVDRETAIERMFSQKLLFKPGTDHKHSHGAYGLLAALIEKISGMSYYDFLKKNFFDPAGMLKTGEYGQILGLSVNDFAAGGGPNFIGIPNIPPNWGPTSWLIKGSGGMYSSLGDLLKFYEYIRSGKVLDNKHNVLFCKPTANLDGSDRGFELFSVYLPPNTETYLFINEIQNRSLLRQLMNALQSLVKSEHNAKNNAK